MSKIFLMAACLSVTVSLAQEAQFGKPVDADQAVPMARFVETMKDRESMEAKVEGKVVECCQTKGCWMKLDAGDGTTMRVKFRDYGFFVPKNSAGKTAVIQGTATVETVSVAELKHYAEDAGKPQEEIDRITEPKRQLVFVADGVLLKD
jgi:hypothetical protein